MSVPSGAGIRVASAPVSFGVDEVIADDAWMPEPDDVLAWMAGIGYEGTEMGPPGYLGPALSLRERLVELGLELVGAFLPLHLSRDERMADDLRWLEQNLDALLEAAPPPSRPLAVLSEAIDEPLRLAHAGRIGSHHEALLDDARWDVLISNLHRAAERCRERGVEPVIHPHAGTYLETADEIARLMDRMDSQLVGLCVDSGHFRYGEADPARAIRDYATAVRHVHLKDALTRVRDDVAGRGGALEEAVRLGVFCPCGDGDAGIDGVIAALLETGYRGWVVVEQDQLLGRDDTPETLVAGQAANRRYLAERGL